MEIGPTPPPAMRAPDAALREAARQLEAGFLAEMLKSAGIGKPPEAFGGGAGEEHFSSLMVQQYAERLVDGGGIGLAEQIFNELRNRT